ncbi:hypothetical protein IAT38_000001 [Cryptococcus sp. DSM 104549]
MLAKSCKPLRVHPGDLFVDETIEENQGAKRKRARPAKKDREGHRAAGVGPGEGGKTGKGREKHKSGDEEDMGRSAFATGLGLNTSKSASVGRKVITYGGKNNSGKGKTVAHRIESSAGSEQGGEDERRFLSEAESNSRFGGGLRSEVGALSDCVIDYHRSLTAVEDEVRKKAAECERLQERIVAAKYRAEREKENAIEVERERMEVEEEIEASNEEERRAREVREGDEEMESRLVTRVEELERRLAQMKDRRRGEGQSYLPAEDDDE